MNQTKAAADMVIFGGGIAGLWVLNRLRQLGFSAILFEPVALGGGQTNKAQGIIHGGMKYALQGVFTSEANAMAAMPERWKACLKGKGDIDLSSVPVLSKKQYLWSQGKLTAKLTGFLAGVSLASKVKSLKKNQYPTVFQHPEFKGQVFALDELVVDGSVSAWHSARMELGQCGRHAGFSHHGGRSDRAHHGLWVNPADSVE